MKGIMKFTQFINCYSNCRYKRSQWWMECAEVADHLSLDKNTVGKYILEQPPYDSLYDRDHACYVCQSGYYEERLNYAA